MESWLCFWKLTRSFRINSILRCHARKMVKLLQSLPIDGLEAFLYEPWLSLWATAMLSLENLFFTLAPASFAKYCPCEVSPFFSWLAAMGMMGILFLDLLLIFLSRAGVSRGWTRRSCLNWWQSCAADHGVTRSVYWSVQADGGIADRNPTFADICFLFQQI